MTDQQREQPESFRARSMNVSLTVKDLERSVQWYEQAGFTVDQRMEREGQLRAVALKAGEVRILLNLDDGAKGWDRVKGEGFSIQFNTAQNIDEVAAAIKQRGGTLESEPADMPWGVRMFRLKDPDGYKISISSLRPRFNSHRLHGFKQITQIWRGNVSRSNYGQSWEAPILNFKFKKPELSLRVAGAVS